MPYVVLTSSIFKPYGQFLIIDMFGTTIAGVGVPRSSLGCRFAGFSSFNSDHKEFDL